MLSVTTQQLQYLETTSRHSTWAEAAHELGVSASALSQGLAELEKRVGFALFERSGRSRTLTANGEIAVVHARDILATIGDLSRWVAATRDGQSGSLRLGMVDVAAVHRYPNRLRTFRTERPEVDLHLTVAPSSQLIADVRAGHLDVVVVVEPPAPVADLETVPAFTDALAVYAPPGVADRTENRWGPWVTFPESSHTRQLIAGALRSRGVPFKVEAESHQPEVLREMVRLSMGWTVLPRSQAETGDDPLTPVQDEPLLERQLLVAVRRRAGLPPSARDLVELLSGADRKEPTVTGRRPGYGSGGGGSP